MERTPRFALPFLVPGQLQKELFHNEALQIVDVLLCPVVEGDPLTTPPANPGVGSCYIVATSATGAWQGEDGAVACFTDAGWRFIAARDGMIVVDKGTAGFFSRRDGAWEAGIFRAREVRIEGLTVLRDRQPAIADPTGGEVVDGECRAAVGQLLGAMRAHGLIG